MTIQRMIELLEIEHECMLRGAHDDCDRNCADCELVQDDGDLHEMYTNVIALLKEQEKLVNVDKLREKLGFAESCEKCKKNSWRCQRDTYFSEMDFCSRLDSAIEELIHEGR